MAHDVLKVKRLTPTAKLPTRGTSGAAGWDLYLDEDCYVGPGQTARIHTGIAVAIPNGFAGLIKARSSVFSKGFSIDGLIDSDFVGPVQVVVRNNDQVKGQWFEAGQRVAQFVIIPVPEMALEEVAELESTDRGEGGFGSTGSR